MSGAQRLPDWTGGEPAIVYQHCAACGHVQYFQRKFCSACGIPEPAAKKANGKGVVYATSLVMRAATPETKAHVPYNIVLVDTAEGFRMMAHGDRDLVIGDTVAVRFERFTDRIIPVFQKESEAP
ncbi:MAG: OB-fold domain-containing protein [Proteobacteria bacterium]|nr:OB-fold domain-containing protein [Pseudomonadota bacterium]